MAQQKQTGPIGDVEAARVPGGGRTSERPISIPVEGETSAGAAQDEQAPAEG